MYFISWMTNKNDEQVKSDKSEIYFFLMNYELIFTNQYFYNSMIAYKRWDSGSKKETAIFRRSKKNQGGNSGIQARVLP